ncbi:MAG TPA: hypothetical protein VFG86_17765 [Chloroflexota bacterium]|nr:hypothetical protein [Chloroflexota bacterium]
MLDDPLVDEVAGFLAHGLQALIELGLQLGHRAQRHDGRRQRSLAGRGHDGERGRVLDGEREGQRLLQGEAQRQLTGSQVARERRDLGQYLARQRIRSLRGGGGHGAGRIHRRKIC